MKRKKNKIKGFLSNWVDSLLSASYKVVSENINLSYEEYCERVLAKLKEDRKEKN